jgi:CheY-like chemotaxis protein
MTSASVVTNGDHAQNINLLIGEGSEAADTQRERPSVLVVDDEQLIVDTLAEVLEDAGFYVLPAYDGWTALDKVAHFRPDYLLSDVLMPKLNGVELAIAIQRMYPSTRVTLFSGQTGISEILLYGQEQGLNFEMLAKPLHPLKIVDAGELTKQEGKARTQWVLWPEIKS